MEFQISSTSIGLITEALSKAQGKIENALKDSKNPFFKSSYADLSSVMAVTKGPLSDNQLSFSSSLVQSSGVNYLVCTLSHISGEWFRSYMPLIVSKQDMQSLGAAISYARRFCLAALCHVGVEENDGEGCVDRGTGEVKVPVKLEKLTDYQKEKISCLLEGIDDEEYLDKLCKFLNVKNILEIGVKDFEKVITSLEKKIGG